MVSALAVGNTIFKRAKTDNIDITPMKLQKLIYIVYKSYYKKPENHYSLNASKFGSMDQF